MTRLRALALIAAFSLAPHLKGLSAPPLDYHFHRQVNTAAVARNYSRNGLNFLTPQIDWAGPYRGKAATEFPFYMWLTGLLWKLGGLGALWGRLLSAAFSMLAAAYLFFFLERRLAFSEALASACLFSLSPLVVYFGRTVQPEALAMAAALAALYHWDRFLDEDRWQHWTAAVFGAFLAVAHKLPYGYCLLTLACLAVSKKGCAVLRKPAVLAAPAACLAGVFAWYRYAAGGAYVVPTNASEFRQLFQYGRLPFFVQFQLVSRLPELVTTWPGMALAAAGARELWTRGQRFFAAWWGTVVLYIVAGGGYTFYHEYTSLPFAPVMAAFMGTGLLALRKRADAPAKRAALAAVLLALPVTSFYRIKHWYGQNFAFLAGAGALADSVSGPDDLFVCTQRANSVYLYYLDRRGWSWDFIDESAAMREELAKRIALGAKFLAAAKPDLTADQRAWIESRYPKVAGDDSFSIYKLR